MNTVDRDQFARVRDILYVLRAASFPNSLFVGDPRWRVDVSLSRVQVNASERIKGVDRNKSA